MLAQQLDIEPGLKGLFRLFNLILWVLLSLGVCSLFAPDVTERSYATLFLWLQTSLLLLIIWWNRPRPGLTAAPTGTRWLTLALWIASLGPILANFLAVLVYLQLGLRGDAIPVDPAGLYFWLVLPLLLVSTQYGMKAMLAFVVGTSILPALLPLALGELGAERVVLNGGHGAVRLFLFLIVGFIVVRLTHAQRQHRRELAEKNAQLAHYATTLEQLAISRERNRMARELHDTLAHTLSAVNVQLAALEVQWDADPAAARATLSRTQALTRSGLHEARRALHALRASPIAELGLVLALKRQAEMVAARAGLTLRLNLPESLNGLPDEIEQNLYRMAEEAMNNVVRHANATQLLVSLRCEGRQLRLIVLDNGVGFDPSAGPPDGHYGLIGMGERALLLNAALDIDSAPGAGTRVQVTVTLDSEKT